MGGTSRLLYGAVVAAALCAIALGQAGPAQVLKAPPAAPAAAMTDETPDMWFVELASPPLAAGGTLRNLQSDKQAFRAAAAKAGVRFTERFAYDSLWNGLAVRVGRGEVTRLAKLPGVVNVFPVISVTLEPGTPVSLDMATALTMTGADIAQNELGLTGAGIKVGIIDSGIDYLHPDLGGCFGDGCRVITGYDFVGDNWDPSLPPMPDNDPRDTCNSHGTHVAGIVGANGAVRGVAPGVLFGAYKIFGCGNNTTSDLILVAMERAYADGMQIVNLSLGAGYQWPQYPTARAASLLATAGVVVVAAMGNKQANGLYAGDAPGVGDNVIGVASFDNIAINTNAFSVSPDGMLIGYNAATGAPPAPVSGSLPMARTGTPSSTADACSPLPAGSLTGKAALIRRGGCTFYAKAFNAQTAGAAAVVLYNNAAGQLNPTVAGTPPITIPVVATTQAEGELIDSRIAAGAVTMTWTPESMTYPNSTGNLVSNFSSFGVTPDLITKPDIGAPGGYIRSTIPIPMGSYANYSGTSMSTPHVAGAAALLIEAHPGISPEMVNTVFQNSAKPKPWAGNPSLGYLDFVHVQGAGMLDIVGAVEATTWIRPGKLSLGESQAGPATRRLTLQNFSDQPVTYVLSHEPALSTGPDTFSVSAMTGFATAAFSAPSVTVPPRWFASVDVTVTANPGLPDHSLYGGYIVFTPDNGGAVLRVPYTGFKGDYQTMPVLTPTQYGFPWLAKLVGSNYVNQPAGATYTLANGDVPYILAHFHHQSRTVRMEVRDAVTGRFVGLVSQNIQFMPRNSSATSFFAFVWDGTVTNATNVFSVPNGQYVIAITVQKALVDLSKPQSLTEADFERWVSPVITVAR